MDDEYEWEGAKEWAEDKPDQPLDHRRPVDVQSQARRLHAGYRTDPGPQPQYEAWKVQARAKPRPKPKTLYHKARPAPTLYINRDSSAQAAWRKNLPPTGVFRTPPGFDLGRSAKVLGRSKDDTSASLRGAFPVLDQISTDTDTYIVPALFTHRGVNLNIWGEPEQVSNARSRLQSWVQAVQMEAQSTKRGHPSWAHDAAYSLRSEDKQLRAAEIEARRQSFKQVPPSHAVFNCVGSFKWPVEQTEHRVEDVLGQNTEALDPIRTECSCHVVYDSKRRTIKVMSHDEDNVKSALNRIRGTWSQIVAAQMGPHQENVLRPISGNGLKVKLSNYTDPSGKERLNRPTIHRGTVNPKDVLTWGALDESQATGDDSKTIKDACARTLFALKHYHGELKLHVHLGTFLLESYRQHKDGFFELDAFVEMIKDSRFQGRVTKELGNGKVERELLRRFAQAKNLFAPSNVLTSDLTETKPSYSCTFRLQSPDVSGDIRLDVWHQDSDAEGLKDRTTSDRLEHKTTRWEGGSQREQGLLGISHINLERGTAWHFDMRGAPVIATSKAKTPNLLRFIHEVRVNYVKAQAFTSYMHGPQTSTSTKPDSGAAKAKSERFISFKPYPATTVLSIEQRAIWHYRLRKAPYVCRVTKFQYIENTKSKIPIVAGSDWEKFHEPRWAVDVISNDWDVVFGEHKNLGIGVGTKVAANVQRLFPKLDETGTGGSSTVAQEDGFEDFIEKLTEIESITYGR